MTSKSTLIKIDEVRKLHKHNIAFTDLKGIGELTNKELINYCGGESSTKETEQWLRALGGNNNGF